MTETDHKNNKTHLDPAKPDAGSSALSPRSDMARQLAGGGAAEQLSMLAAVCIIIVCLLIVASTVLTKQHVIVDVVTGLIMAVVCWILAPVVAAMIC